MANKPFKKRRRRISYLISFYRINLYLFNSCKNTLLNLLSPFSRVFLFLYEYFLFLQKIIIVKINILSIIVYYKLHIIYYLLFLRSLGNAIFLSTTTCSSKQLKISSISFLFILGVIKLTIGTTIKPTIIAIAPALIGEAI